MSKSIKESFNREKAEKEIQIQKEKLEDMKEQYRNYEISDEKKEEIEDLAKKYAKKIMFKLTNIQVPQVYLKTECQ